MHKQHFSPEINPMWAGYRDQKDNSANKNTFIFLTFLEDEVMHGTETGSEGEFLANFTTSFLFGQGIGEPIDVIIKLPNGFLPEASKMQTPASYLETLTTYLVKHDW